jgi:FkbM family methyltransferase
LAPSYSAVAFGSGVGTLHELHKDERDVEKELFHKKQHSRRVELIKQKYLAKRKKRELLDILSDVPWFNSTYATQIPSSQLAREDDVPVHWREFLYGDARGERMSASRAERARLALLDAPRFAELAGNGLTGGFAVIAYQTRPASSPHAAASTIFRATAPEWIYEVYFYEEYRSLALSGSHATGAAVIEALECDAQRLRMMGALMPSEPGSRTVAVDIGAASGDTMVAMALVADQTVAFEPGLDHKRYFVSAAVAKLNPELNITVIPCGIGGTPGTVMGTEVEFWDKGVKVNITPKLGDFRIEMARVLGSEEALKDVRYVKMDTDEAMKSTLAMVAGALLPLVGAKPPVLQVENDPAQYGWPREYFLSAGRNLNPAYVPICTRQISFRGPHSLSECAPCRPTATVRFRKEECLDLLMVPAHSITEEPISTLKKPLAEFKFFNAGFKRGAYNYGQKTSESEGQM